MKKIRSVGKVKKKATWFVKGTALVAGKSFKKTLEVSIPPEIRRKSSVVGGLNRMTDAVVAFGSGTKEGDEKSKQYMVRHSIGTAADVAVGVAFFGVPATMVTSFFSDGCKVVSAVFKGAKTEEQEYVHVGEFFNDMSDISDNFMKLFDVPSKKGIEETKDSIEALRRRLKSEGRLSEELSSDLNELEGMCASEKDKDWSKKVQEQLSKIADSRLSQSGIGQETNECIRGFLHEPTLEHMKCMRSSLFSDFKKKGLVIGRKPKKFANDMVESLEKISAEDFHDKMESFIIKQYEIADKTQDKVGDATYYGYRLMHSMLDTTYKGASLFGGHYKKQLKELIEREDRQKALR